MKEKKAKSGGITRNGQRGGREKRNEIKWGGCDRTGRTGKTSGRPPPWGRGRKEIGCVFSFEPWIRRLAGGPAGCGGRGLRVEGYANLGRKCRGVEEAWRRFSGGGLGLRAGRGRGTTVEAVGDGGR